jgi:hypothetical protein
MAQIAMVIQGWYVVIQQTLYQFVTASMDDNPHGLADKFV